MYDVTGYYSLHYNCRMTMIIGNGPTKSAILSLRLTGRTWPAELLRVARHPPYDPEGAA